MKPACPRPGWNGSLWFKGEWQKNNDELLCWFYKQQIQINQSEDLPWKLCMHHGLWFAATLLPNWSMINIRLNISGQGSFDLCSAVRSSAPLACSGCFWIIHSLEYKLETVSANYKCTSMIYKCTKNELKKLRGFFFFWKEGDLVFLIQCQRTRRWVWEWRWESDVRGQGQTEQRWKELSIEGSFLLDVILADENQEEGTSLHLPALLDKLQGVLNTHTHRYTHVNCHFSGFVWFLKVIVWDNVDVSFWQCYKLLAPYHRGNIHLFRSYPVAALLRKCSAGEFDTFFFCLKGQNQSSTDIITELQQLTECSVTVGSHWTECDFDCCSPCATLQRH